MLMWIRCPTCRDSLGHLAPVYRLILARRMLRRREGAGPLSPKEKENLMGDVLEALGLRGCCRTRMVSAMFFPDQY